jgi:hypothetical protein
VQKIATAHTLLQVKSFYAPTVEREAKKLEDERQLEPRSIPAAGPRMEPLFGIEEHSRRQIRTDVLAASRCYKAVFGNPLNTRHDYGSVPQAYPAWASDPPRPPNHRVLEQNEKFRLLLKVNQFLVVSSRPLRQSRLVYD